MPDGQVLEFSGLTKRFGTVTAVSGFTARVEPGVVTGFLGPNGAGKTTTLRTLLGLVRADAGTATIGGLPYARLAQPLQTVGAVLEASSFHPGRSAANHLKVYAQAAGLPVSRVDDALGTVGLADAAGRKVGGFSLGMRQRLGLAYALLGDPGVLVLDEPTNGLDPEGIKWIRGFLRELARQGRTVLVSSHLLSEVQQTVDSLLIIAHGRLVFQGGLHELTDPSEYATVVDAPDRAALAAALAAAGTSFEVLRSGLTVRGMGPADVGQIAASGGIALSALDKRGPALEEVFLDLVNGVRTHPSAAGTSIPGDAGHAGAAGEAEHFAVAPAATPYVPSADIHAEDEASDPSGAGATSPEAASSTAAPEPSHEEPSDGVAATSPDGEEPSAPADEAGTASPGGEDAAAAVDAPTPAAGTPTAHAASFAVASTGVIDIVTAAADDGEAGSAETSVTATEDDAPADEDEPAHDDAPEAEPADRPWEHYVKTDADVEADRFFGHFDDGTGAPVAEPAADVADADEDEDAEERHPWDEPEPGRPDAEASASAPSDPAPRNEEGGELR